MQDRHRLRNTVVGCLCVMLVAATPGCSIFFPWSQDLSVNTSEPGAKIYVNGELVGHGNMTTTVRRDKTCSVMAKLDGFYPAQTTISTQISAVGIVDIVGTFFFLFPILGLLAPGAWKLDRDSVNLVLNPMPQPERRAEPLRPTNKE